MICLFKGFDNFINSIKLSMQLQTYIKFSGFYTVVIKIKTT